MAPITTIASLFSSGTPFNAPLNGLDASSPDFLANVGDTKAKHGVAHAISTAIRNVNPQDKLTKFLSVCPATALEPQEHLDAFLAFYLNYLNSNTRNRKQRLDADDWVLAPAYKQQALAAAAAKSPAARRPPPPTASPSYSSDDESPQAQAAAEVIRSREAGMIFSSKLRPKIATVVTMAHCIFGSSATNGAHSLFNEVGITNLVNCCAEAIEDPTLTSYLASEDLLPLVVAITKLALGARLYLGFDEDLKAPVENSLNPEALSLRACNQDKFIAEPNRTLCTAFLALPSDSSSNRVLTILATELNAAIDRTPPPPPKDPTAHAPPTTLAFLFNFEKIYLTPSSRAEATPSGRQRLTALISTGERPLRLLPCPLFSLPFVRVKRGEASATPEPRCERGGPPRRRRGPGGDRVSPLFARAPLGRGGRRARFSVTGVQSYARLGELWG